MKKREREKMPSRMWTQMEKQITKQEQKNTE